MGAKVVRAVTVVGHDMVGHVGGVSVQCVRGAFTHRAPVTRKSKHPRFLSIEPDVLYYEQNEDERGPEEGGEGKNDLRTLWTSLRFWVHKGDHPGYALLLTVLKTRRNRPVTPVARMASLALAESLSLWSLFLFLFRYFRTTLMRWSLVRGKKTLRTFSRVTSTFNTASMAERKTSKSVLWVWVLVPKELGSKATSDGGEEERC